MSLDPAKLSGVDVLQLQIDYASTTIQYIGLAPPNAKITDPMWQITRLTFDSTGRTVKKEFAGLTANFNQIWTNRTNLTYVPT